MKQLGLVGLHLLIFAKEHLKGRISNIHKDIIKAGVGGNFGNKGSIMVKMDIDNSTICFVNCHL